MKKLAAALFVITLAFPFFSQTQNEIDKVDLIISKMSPRAKRELVIFNKAQFVKDLKVVLEEEKKYKGDPLPLLFLIDKQHKAPEGYVPVTVPLVKNDDYAISRNDLSLRIDIIDELVKLCRAAQKDNVSIMVSSTYRSFEYQKNLFQRYAKQDGEKAAERYSARPGTSQHQLGTAIDFGSITHDFINTKAGQWLYNNAHKYGWSLSFPQEYEDVTGYMYECWHYRFIGVAACQLQKKYFNNIQQYMLEFIDLWKNEK